MLILECNEVYQPNQIELPKTSEDNSANSIILGVHNVVFINRFKTSYRKKKTNYNNHNSPQAVI